MLIFARISRNHYQSIICTIMYKNLKSVGLESLSDAMALSGDELQKQIAYAT